MHSSPRHPGCLENALEPNVHFGLYNSDNLTDTIEYWLSNPKKRINGVIEARKIFASDHSWDKRAEQILDDLS
jgi:glycosyltransferase involved in cell wall biosynthesis